MEDLISKKALLERYGISYGALYRWKRMGLIPEDWFLRRSAPTGQETFFHTGQICPRVELILSRREVSLEDLAAELSEKKVSKPVKKLVIETRFAKKSFPFDELISVTLEEGENKTDIMTYLKGEQS